MIAVSLIRLQNENNNSLLETRFNIIDKFGDRLAILLESCHEDEFRNVAEESLQDDFLSFFFIVLALIPLAIEVWHDRFNDWRIFVHFEFESIDYFVFKFPLKV